MFDGFKSRLVRLRQCTESAFQPPAATAAPSRSEVIVRLTAMAKRHGIQSEELGLHLPAYPIMLAACARCPDLPACERFLANGSAPKEKAGFCPNHLRFLRMRPSA